MKTTRFSSPGGGADVVVEAEDFYAGDAGDHGFHGGAGGFDEVGADLLEQVAALFAGEGFDELLFGGGEDALEADDQQVVDEMGADVAGAAAHVFLLEAAHAFADGGFDFTGCLHQGLANAENPLIFINAQLKTLCLEMPL